MLAMSFLDVKDFNFARAAAGAASSVDILCYFLRLCEGVVTSEQGAAV
jgi:hypothetical protein